MDGKKKEANFVFLDEIQSGRNIPRCGYIEAFAFSSLDSAENVPLNLTWDKNKLSKDKLVIKRVLLQLTGVSASTYLLNCLQISA